MAELGVTPFDTAATIATDDMVNFPTGPSSAIFVGTGGDLNVQFQSGPAVVFKNVPSGTLLPLKLIRVNAQNTSAQDLVKLNYV